MNKEEFEQFEEIKQIVKKGFQEADCRHPYTNEPYPYFNSQIVHIAQALYEAGYRLQNKKPQMIMAGRRRGRTQELLFYLYDELKLIQKERNDWKKRAEVAEEISDIQDRILREFAVQVSCKNCPFCLRCNIEKPPQSDNDYEVCRNNFFQQIEKEIKEKINEGGDITNE